jgi:hypothetical protein
MWAGVTFAAIAVTGAGFMLWFLLGLVGDKAPSVCYWVLPVRGRPKKGRHLEFLGGIYVDQDCRAPKEKRSDYYVELLENEGHAKECISGLVAIHVRPMPAKLGWRTIQPRRCGVFHEREF